MQQRLGTSASSAEDRHKLLFGANVRLNGPINEESAASMLQQLQACRKNDGPIIVEVTTTGGDADAARRIALEIGLLRRELGRETIFIGKSFVYSAGRRLCRPSRAQTDFSPKTRRSSSTSGG